MLFPCPECRDEQIFEQPSCIDGHGPDCPEWMCQTCGFGLFLATYPEIDAVVPTARPSSVPATATTPSQGRTSPSPTSAPHAPVRRAA